MFPIRFIPAGEEFYSYRINNSCRFNDDDSAHTTWTPGGAADSSRIMTIHFGVKRCNLGSLMYVFSAGAATDEDWIGFDANNKLIVGFDNNVDGQLITSQVFRDPTSHYWVTVGIDTTQATAGDRVDIEINGSEITAYATETYPAQNYDFAGFLQNGVVQYISRLSSAGSNYLDGYLSELHVIDGTKYTASDFGELKNNIWIPKRFSGSYGSNGFYLNFSNSSNFGEDQSGNNNDFTDSGLATNDQVIDTPTNNYCVLNTIHHLSTATIANGSLECSGAENEYGTYGLTSGKWAWQLTAGENGSFGVEAADGTEEVAADLSGEVIEMLLDLDNGTLKKKVDGGGLEDIELTIDLTKTWYPHFKAQCTIDFGQQSYTPSDGIYKTICTSNMSDPTVKDSTEGFYVNKRTGTGAEATISDVNFDVSAGALLWIKSTDTATGHYCSDTLRGATLDIYPHSGAAEVTTAQGLKSFSSTGYVLGTDTGRNDNTKLYVDYVFREGATHGFDMVSFSGTGSAHTESHSLGVIPDFIIVKNRTDLVSWICYHSLIAADAETDYGVLDTDAAFADNSIMWNDTAPTSTVFTVGTSNAVNGGGGDDMIAFLFASIDGFSKAFSYTGNGNADGPYIDLGFRPAFILIKEGPALGSWVMIDCKRDGYNVDNNVLFSDGTNTESTADWADLTSKGFKIRSTSSHINTNTNLYIGFAIAEQTGKWSNAR